MCFRSKTQGNIKTEGEPIANRTKSKTQESIKTGGVISKTGGVKDIKENPEDYVGMKVARKFEGKFWEG